MAVADVLLRPSVMAGIVLIVLYVGYGRYQRNRLVPQGVPWSGTDPDVRKAKTTPEMLKTLKQKFIDKNLKIIYDSPGNDPTLILPPDAIPWIIGQPDAVLSAREMHREALQSDWTFLDQNIVKSPLHEHVIRQNMVRNLNDFTDPVMDELRQCFEDYWGDSPEWRQVPIWDSMLKFFSRTSNRMFVGLPLCRNETFLAACRGYANSIMISGFFLKFMPALIKPVLGYAAIAPNYWHYRKAAKYLVPLIEDRLQKIQQNPEKDPADFLPNDFVTWSIVESRKSPDPRERTPELIAKRVMTTNFAAIHTTTMTSTNMLLDLLGCGPASGVLESLTDEIHAIDSARAGDWSKASLAAMTRMDSALRESMRLSGFVVWGVARKVVRPEGVTLPDGTHVPYWANLAVLAHGIHHDDAVYEDPFEYDAFRFSRQREALDEASRGVHVGEEGLVQGEQGHAAGQERNMNKVLEGKNLSTVTTGGQFMQFGASLHRPSIMTLSHPR